MIGYTAAAAKTALVLPALKLALSHRAEPHEETAAPEAHVCARRPLVQNRPREPTSEAPHYQAGDDLTAFLDSLGARKTPGEPRVTCVPGEGERREALGRGWSLTGRVDFKYGIVVLEFEENLRARCTSAKLCRRDFIDDAIGASMQDTSRIATRTTHDEQNACSAGWSPRRKDSFWPLSARRYAIACTRNLWW